MRAVFVSSTFRDMQFERDALLTRVVPRMNAFLGQYAEEVHFGDLRWGVNTTELESEESSKKVLRVCLDQIDDCKPYMIIFIGERYGWIPSADLLHEAALLKGMDAEAISADTSVTELEIEYGALLNPDFEGRILFYFRNPFDMSAMTDAERASYVSESELHKSKVRELKERILEKYPDYVRHYDVRFDETTRALVGLEPLMDMIYEDLKRIFDIDLGYLASLPREERALENSLNYFRKLAENTVMREESVVNSFDYDGAEYCYQHRYTTNPVFEVISGDEGAGSKTVLAQQLVRITERGSYAIPLVYGLDEFTASDEDIRRALAYRLEALMELEHTGDGSADRLADLLREYTFRKELPYLHILLMNLPKSMLSTFHIIAAKYPNLFGIGFHVHFRTPLKRSDPVPFFLKSYSTFVSELTEEQQRDVIAAILKTRRKELPRVVIDEILAHRGAEKPLYLSLIVERLLMLDSQDFARIREMGDGMDNINKYMIRIVREAGDDIADIAHDLLRELCERINPTMIPHLIAHLTLRNHFNEDGIRQMFEYHGWGYNALDYTLFKKTFPSLVYENSRGFLWFTNDEVKEGAQRLLSEYGMDGEMDKAIEFVYTVSEGLRAKALIAFLAEGGYADRMWDAMLPYLDIPLINTSTASPDPDAAKEYAKVASRLYKELSDSVERDDELALLLFTELRDRILGGAVKHPYTILSGIFNFLIPDLTDYNNLLNSAYVLTQITEVFEEYMEECEPCMVAAYLLRYMICPAFGDRCREDWFIDFIKSNADFTRRVGAKPQQTVMRLIEARLLYIGETANYSADQLYAQYSAIKDYDDPRTQRGADGVFDLLRRYCATMRRQFVDNQIPNYLDMTASGDMSGFLRLGSKESQIYWLAFSGYVYSVEGDTEEAKRYYLALLAVHREIILKEGIGEFFLGHYITLVDGAIEYLGKQGCDVSAACRATLDWGVRRLAESYGDFGITAALMKLHIHGANNKYLESNIDYFYQIWSCIRGQIYSASEMEEINRIPEYFCRFNYVFPPHSEGDEMFDYYSDLYADMLWANSDSWDEEVAAVTTMYFVIEYAADQSLKNTDVLDALLDKAVSDYPELKKLSRKIHKLCKKHL